MSTRYEELLQDDEQRQLLRAREADVNAVIKFVLSHLDEVAMLPPDEACEPYAMEERKRLIKRRLWEHHRGYLRRAR